MSVLNDDSLKNVKLENDKPKQVFGRPVKLISDLLDTIFHLKKEKNKWQDLAKKRGDALRRIQEVSSLSLEKRGPDDTDRSLGADSQ